MNPITCESDTITLNYSSKQGSPEQEHGKRSPLLDNDALKFENGSPDIKKLKVVLSKSKQRGTGAGIDPKSQFHK
jgi:hypothetical protein